MTLYNIIAYFHVVQYCLDYPYVLLIYYSKEILTEKTTVTTGVTRGVGEQLPPPNYALALSTYPRCQTSSDFKIHCPFSYIVHCIFRRTFQLSTEFLNKFVRLEFLSTERETEWKVIV